MIDNKFSLEKSFSVNLKSNVKSKQKLSKYLSVKKFKSRPNLREGRRGLNKFKRISFKEKVN